MDNTKVSEFVTMAEAIKSQQAVRLGLDNKPTADQLLNMQYVAKNVFDRVRKHFGKPIAITSFFRCYALNKTIGGSATSQHCNGEAIDIDGDVLGGVHNAEIFHFIKDNIDFDQLIWEFGTNEKPDWVHVSLKRGLNRRNILRAKKIAGKTYYEPYR
jgi:hypothetical protein